MPEIVIFGGTTEGRREAEQLFTQGNAVTVSVTSAYARSLLPPQVKCHVGVLNRQEMLAWLSKERPGLVIDATHPYAVQATRNIRACCAALGIPYERIERPPQSASWRQDVQHVPDAGAAAQALPPGCSCGCCQPGKRWNCAPLPVFYPPISSLCRDRLPGRSTLLCTINGGFGRW